MCKKIEKSQKNRSSSTFASGGDRCNRKTSR